MKFFRWPSRELVLKGQITLGEGWTRLPLPSNVGDILLFFFIVLKGEFFFNFIFLVSIFFYFSSPPSFFLSLITLFPSLGGGLFGFPILSSFSSSFFFPYLAYFVFFFIFCFLNVGGEYGEDKGICFSIVAIKKGAHFLVTPLSNFLKSFLVDAWYRQ